MYGSRRCWSLVALGVFLAAAAVLLRRPAPLLGAAGVGAVLVVGQLAAVRAFERATHLDVTLDVNRRHATVDQPVTCRLVAERPAHETTAVEVTAARPLAARGADEQSRTVRLDPWESRAATTFELTFPVAGRFQFDDPAVRLTDGLGLFTERLTRGPAPTVEVDPRGPRDLHVGRGGERVLGAYGEHETGLRGAGVLPEELREYAAGDPADRIDWKATARLARPFVREFEAETDRETVLVVDHRAAMAAGTGGETMLAYARAVALGVAGTAAAAADPLGLYTVGDAGITFRQRPSPSPSAVGTVRSRLQRLEPTAAATAGGSARPERARRLDERLTDDTFSRRLRPFLAATDAYVERLSGDPLFGAVSEVTRRTATGRWIVLVTDDADHDRVREATRLAARRATHVLVFLTPGALFDRHASLESAYERYAAFEDLRRELDRLPAVSAFEVGPGDRVDRLLAARRARTRGS